MIDINLSINNRADSIALPVIPSEFQVVFPHNNETVKTINAGDLKLIGKAGLKSITLESFFPSNNYDFLRDDSYKGWEYVKKIESWKFQNVPIRLIIADETRDIINLAVVINSFTYGIADGSNDIEYSLEFEEFRFM